MQNLVHSMLAADNVHSQLHIKGTCIDYLSVASPYEKAPSLKPKKMFHTNCWAMSTRCLQVIDLCQIWYLMNLRVWLNSLSVGVVTCTSNTLLTRPICWCICVMHLLESQHSINQFEPVLQLHIQYNAQQCDVKSSSTVIPIYNTLSTLHKSNLHPIGECIYPKDDEKTLFRDDTKCTSHNQYNTK